MTRFILILLVVIVLAACSTVHVEKHGFHVKPIVIEDGTQSHGPTLSGYGKQVGGQITYEVSGTW